MLHIGLDIGSTTIKAIAIDTSGNCVFSRYERHHAKIKEKLINFLQEILKNCGNTETFITITGSIGMGIAEQYSIPFIQEVVATTKYIQHYHPETKTVIDIGGEDAKIVFFENNKAHDLRMNGNCAGGTGAFIDQMALLLGITNDELSNYAQQSTQIYPVASRCGVFCKTDIQNLIAKNADISDISASIFHAVAIQTIMTLSHGKDIEAPIALCGGPLTFLPSLRHAFMSQLNLTEEDLICDSNSNMMPAWGAAINSKNSTTSPQSLTSIIEYIETNDRTHYSDSLQLSPLFENSQEYDDWKKEKNLYQIRKNTLKEGKQEAYLGIDSGSTTTKIIVINEKHEILFSYYHPNNGNPIATVRAGLELLQKQCEESSTDLIIKGSCSTGYGEDLIKAAFNLEHGIVETIAHFKAAHNINPNVSFILDIGGQDMKAIFVNNGVINHIEINEACSSGCGTFIETFAKSMGYSTDNFAEEACSAKHPCDLGTRCTVFMNSKVKQVLREGATIGDIAAGLSYSVINNCLYKVLKLKNLKELGEHIVVQGGTMHNNAVCRALEKLTGHEIFRSDCPELMGAYGAALYAFENAHQEIILSNSLANINYKTTHHQCKGCENHCLINKYTFDEGRTFFAGNRCEKIFNNKGADYVFGKNIYQEKYKLLFETKEYKHSPKQLNIGIPRILNMYEEFPFWSTLFEECGINVVLSSPSTYPNYEKGVKHVMSDNICFPAKLSHSHILDLLEKGCDRIFFPYVIFEKKGEGQNSYNCPIVSGYSDVIKNAMELPIPLDSPAITFQDTNNLYKECQAYLKTLKISDKIIKKAFQKAIESYTFFDRRLKEINQDVYESNVQNKKLTILLAGRPYHTDPLIQHKIADMISSLGVDVITDDIVRGESIDISDVHFVSQWSFPERILKAAKWVATKGKNVQFIEMTSFGCGPDSFMLDEINTLLNRHGKVLTQLKIDDVCNIGSLKLRVRSVVDSLRLNYSNSERHQKSPFITTPIFDNDARLRCKKILVPYFTPFISPLIPAFMKLSGYDFDVLPMSNKESDELGLKYANNEICYPATLIIGDLIHAFTSGKYNPEETAVAITQTGGQCRATNYISLIKKGMVDAGFNQVPVISLAFSKDNIQPGFEFKWKKIINIAVATILFTDAFAKMYYAALPREKEKGLADNLKEKYLNLAKNAIENNCCKDLESLLTLAARDFDSISLEIDTKKVGIVGEIFLKFHFYAQRHITEWLIENNIEIEPPLLTPFFLQAFVNMDVNNKTFVDITKVPRWIRKGIYLLIRKRIKKYDSACSAYRYYQPFDDVYDLAQNSESIISLNAQFGEGWLLPGEIATMAKHKINHVVSLQPFGCIANHIISKGIEKKIHQMFPGMKFLTLDFDSGVSEVNITNRMLLFINDLIES